MTTDAKIGLLLGLVFIVIIAFVINGLPSFAHKGPSSNDLTKNYVMGIGNKPVGLPSSQPFEAASSDNNAASPQASAKSGGQSPITQVNNPIDVPMPLKEAEVAVGAPRPEQSEQTPSEVAIASADNQTTQTEADKMPCEEQKSTAYIVKRGDNLGLIAQNCYGTQGAKKENVNKIVKANHLKGNQIYVGQKLVIPTDLTKSSPSVFETVKSTAVSAVSQKVEDKVQKTEAAGQKTEGLKDYVVKKDDYPWKIAAKELGSGTRFKEIFKYNPGISEKTKLDVGMHLKLPAK